MAQPGYTLNIPSANQTIASSQTPIMNNFTELNSDFGTNHVQFIDATPANRGKHNICTLIQRGADQTPSAQTESIFYTKNSPTVNQISAPFFGTLTGGGIPNFYNVPLVIQILNIAVAGVGSSNVLDFIGLAPMSGTVIIYLQNFALHVRTIFSPFIWDGANVYVPGIPPNDTAGAGQLTSSSGTLSRFTTNLGNAGGTILQVVSTSPGICNAIITGTIM